MTRIVFSMAIVPSKSIAIYLVIIHSLMLVTLLSLLANSWWALLTIVFMVLSFVYFYGQTQSLIKLERDVDNGWYCYYQNNKLRSALRLTSSIVTSSLVMLYFNGNNYWQRYSVIIMVDAVDAELFRQLRVYCRDPKTFQK